MSSKVEELSWGDEEEIPIPIVDTSIFAAGQANGMTSVTEYWEDARDEKPIMLVDPTTFSEPELFIKDPLAVDNDQEDLARETQTKPYQRGRNGRTRSAPKVNEKSSDNNPLPSYSSEDAYTAEMDRNIAYIIDESMKLFGLDPRGYHPFYLRIYKYINIGQQHGYIRSTDDIISLWKKYDRISAQMMKEPSSETFTGVESPYGTFIKTKKVVVNGKEVSLKRNEDEIKKRFVELEVSAKDIIDRWKKRQKRKKDILNDLGTRLEFFDQCKTMTFPADCVRMNKLWHRFLYEFAAPVKKMSSGITMKTHKVNATAPSEPVSKLSLPTVTKPTSQISSSANVEMIELEDDDCGSPAEADFEPMEDGLIDMDVGVDKPLPASQLNSTKSDKRRSKRKKVSNFNRSIVKVKIIEHVPDERNQANVPDEGDQIDDPDLEKNNKPLISPKEKSETVGREASNKKKPNLAHLKVAHALKKLKLKRKGASLVKKQAKLENILCSRTYFSHLKKKRSLKNKFMSSPASNASPIVEEVPESPTTPPSSPLPTLIAVDELDKLKSTISDHSFVAKRRRRRSLKKEDRSEPGGATCSICGKVLCSGRYLKQHLKKGHKVDFTKVREKEPRACSIATQPKGTKAKRRPQRKEPRRLCNVCGKSFSRQNDLNRHKLIHHNWNKIRRKAKCPICTEEFWMLWPHYNQVHIQGVEGQEKGTKSTSPDITDIPQPSPEPEKTKPSAGSQDLSSQNCEFCGKFFVSLLNLRRHIETIHRTSGKLFLCQECPKQFKTKDSVDAHMKQVHLGENFRCDVCSRVMQSAGKLWKHKVDIHGMTELEPPPNVTLMQCEVCGEKMLRGMFQHIQKAHPEYANKEQQKMESYHAEEARKRRCERRREQLREWKATGKGPAWWRNYNSNKNLRKRESMGLTEILTCPEPSCGKVFEGNHPFENHLRDGHGPDDNILLILETILFVKKTPNQRWQCVVCEQIIDSVDEVKVHFSMHHQQTLHKIRGDDTPSSDAPEATYCPHCMEKLSTYQALRKHVEKNHPEMSCECPECDWIVISPTELQEHFMLEHADSDPLIEWRKPEEANAKSTAKLKKKDSKQQVKVKTEKPIVKANPEIQVQRPPKPTPAMKGRGRPKRKPIKLENSDSESLTGDSDSDGDYKYSSKRNPITSRESSSLIPTKRSSRNVRSRYKTYREANDANVNDFNLKDCYVYVKRLSEAEIALYCTTPL